MRQDPESGNLPVFHVFLGADEHWFGSRKELEVFLSEREAEGTELEVQSNGAEGDEDEGDSSAVMKASRLHIVELHEVRAINKHLTELREMGFEIDSLIPQERTGIEHARYLLRRGDAQTRLEDLRGLVSAVRAGAEKVLKLTRFKGLGEMDAEELRDTTLDPEHRTLSKVTMEDAAAADELFRVLMGDKVEPRREFIEKHALEVRNLDI